MVDGWSEYFGYRVNILASVLKKFSSPVVVGPGSIAAWGYHPDCAFDQLTRRAIAAFGHAWVSVINPPAYQDMSRNPNDIHFANTTGNIRTITRICYGATRAAMLASTVRERTNKGLEVTITDRAVWGAP